MKVSKVCLVGSVDSSLPLKVPVFWLELHLFLRFFLHNMINMNQLSCVLLKIVYCTELGCTISCFTCCLCKPSPCKAANQKKHRQWKVSKLLRLWSPTWSTWFMSLARFEKTGHWIKHAGLILQSFQVTCSHIHETRTAARLDCSLNPYVYVARGHATSRTSGCYLS